MFESRYMAGSCAHGGAKTGTRWHAVPEGAHFTSKALCGRFPSIQWSDPIPMGERSVTCPTCLKRLAKLAKQVCWPEVEEAMRRSMRGQASDADRGLCQEAWGADQARYRELHTKVRDAAHRSMNPLADES